MVRLKHRYLLVNILYPESKETPNNSRAPQPDNVPYTVQFHRPTSDKLDARLLARMIRDGVAELFGDYGSGMVAGSLQVKYFSPATSTAIIRVSRAHYRLVWAALTFTTRLPRPVDQPCVMQVVRVSGTIKKAEEEAIRRARMGIRRAQRRDGGRKGGNRMDAGDVGWEEDEMGFAGGIEDADELGDEDEESE